MIDTETKKESKLERSKRVRKEERLGDRQVESEIEW